MQNVTGSLESHPEGRKWPYNPILTTTSRVKKVKAKKVKLSSESLNVIPSAAEDDRRLRSQAEYHLSTIKDPLWKRICSEVVRMMGPLAVLKISECRVGPLSSRERRLDLYCPTEEVAQFVQEYAFVILGEIQQYFPELKELKINKPYGQRTS
ncbi:MAG: hypothetical protein KBD90_00960 [Alphaproteobacteria bacterium]|jgi:hypothetical protein|nr:hypothetical protein [Alphaproteobacteria bacterium]